MIWLTFSLVKQNKGRTPAPLYHPSRDSVELLRKFFINAITEPPRDHSTAKQAVSPLATSRVYVSNHDFLQALSRDNYCYMVTGWVDSNSRKAMTDTKQQQFGVVSAISIGEKVCPREGQV